MNQLAPAPSAADPSAVNTPEWTVVGRDDLAVYLRGPGATAVEPADWPRQLRPYLEQVHNVVAVGAKRLASSGHVFSMGEFVVHPKGFHHHGRQVTATAYRFAEEPDVIAGGAMAVRREAFESAGGLAALNDGELGAIRFGLTLRRRGGRCLAVPQAVAHDESTPQPSAEEAAAFRAEWGFDWRAADLDDVREKYADTGLVWHPRFVSPTMPYVKYEQRPAPVWTSYATHAPFKGRADSLADFAAAMANNGPLADVGCGDGLFTHLFALRGVGAVGVDPEEMALDQARQKTAAGLYPGHRPDYRLGRGDALPFADGSLAAVTLLDVIEHLPNPSRVLREIARVLRPGGKVLVVTPAWQYGAWCDPFYHSHEYTAFELRDQVDAIDGLTVVQDGTIGGGYRDILVVAERSPE